MTLFLLLGTVYSNGAIGNESCVYPCDPHLKKVLEEKTFSAPSYKSHNSNVRSVTIPAEASAKEFVIKLVNPDRKVSEGKFPLAELLSTFAILISGTAFIYTIHSENKALTKSIDDDFWMRTITIPLMMKHVLELSSDGLNKYREKNSDIKIFFSDYYIEKSDLIKANFLVSSVIANDLPYKLTSLVDELDGNLGGVSSEDDLARYICQFTRDVVSEFRTRQFNPKIF